MLYCILESHLPEHVTFDAKIRRIGFLKKNPYISVCALAGYIQWDAFQKQTEILAILKIFVTE